MCTVLPIKVSKRKKKKQERERKNVIAQKQEGEWALGIVKQKLETLAAGNVHW